ncbi:MAG: glutamine-hydrolyzing carbamoyl-phosphate synthase small subunit [Pseudomonadota bacterium]
MLQFSPDAALVLSDGSFFMGKGLGLRQPLAGEICFNTAMTGYQEVMTDPSYAEQLVVFSCPHIGNVGCNDLDYESSNTHVRGIVLGDMPTVASNYRARHDFLDWLQSKGVAGICAVDTRQVIRKIAASGQPLQAMIRQFDGSPSATDIQQVVEEMNSSLSLSGQNLVDAVTTSEIQVFDNSIIPNAPKIAVIDYGVKDSILWNLEAYSCPITLFPASASIESVLQCNPQGVLLSNGPGDPRALGAQHYKLVQNLLQTRLPVMGICFGYQMLALALGAKIEQMPTGHHGVNHPVFDLLQQKVVITSQNHEFAVLRTSLPENLEATHVSLFDGSLAGVHCKNRPIFGVQFHPEASPGPHEARYLFDNFMDLVQAHAQT